MPPAADRRMNDTIVVVGTGFIVVVGHVYGFDAGSMFKRAVGLGGLVLWVGVTSATATVPTSFLSGPRLLFRLFTIRLSILRHGILRVVLLCLKLI